MATSLWYPNSLNDILSAHLVEYLHSPGNHASLPLSRDKHDRGLKLFKAFSFIGPFKHNMILPYVIQVVIYVTTWATLIMSKLEKTKKICHKCEKCNSKSCSLKNHISKKFFLNYSLSLKNILYFRRELAKPENQKFLIFLFTFFVC